ncbi:MAG: hypothetical protein ACHQ51_09250, partial [Elusimicrobiota bacterium]
MLFGDPNQAARDKAAQEAQSAEEAQRAADEAARAEEQRRQEQERERKRKQEFDDNKSKLLKEMGGADTGGMGFKDDDDDASAAYEANLRHFRDLDKKERALREKALAKLKGTKDEVWCRMRMSIPFPEPPISDAMNQYQNTVLRYDHQKRVWDERCGGPSAQEGYKGFTDELAGLKPPQKTDQKLAMKSDSDDDEKIHMPTRSAAAGSEISSSRTEAHAESGSGGLAFKSDDDDAPRPAHHAAAVAEETLPPVEEKPIESSRGDDSNPSQPSTPDHGTEAFGAHNADVTAADLAESPAPHLTAPHLAATPAAAHQTAAPEEIAPQASAPKTGSRSAQAGTDASPAPGIPAAASFAGIPIVQGMARAGSAPDVHMEPDARFAGRSTSVEAEPQGAGGTCQGSCADRLLEQQGAALDRFRAQSVEFPKAIIMGHLNYGLSLAKQEGAKINSELRSTAIELPAYFDFTGLKPCGAGVCLGVTDEAASRADKALRQNSAGNSVSDWLHLLSSRENPKGPPPTVVLMKAERTSLSDLAALKEAEGLRAAAGLSGPVPTSFLESSGFEALVESKKGLKDNLQNTGKMVKAVEQSAKDINHCLQDPDGDADQCLKGVNVAFDKGTDLLGGTPAGGAAARVTAARDAYQGFIKNVLKTGEDLIIQTAQCIGRC